MRETLDPDTVVGLATLLACALVALMSLVFMICAPIFAYIGARFSVRITRSAAGRNRRSRGMA